MNKTDPKDFDDEDLEEHIKHIAKTDFRKIKNECLTNILLFSTRI